MAIESFKIIILSYNDGFMLSRLLNDLKSVKDVVVVDSYSTDNTRDIVEGFNRKFIKQKFINQANQINTAINDHFDPNDWVLRLDSDERISSELLLEIDTLVKTEIDFVGYINRNMYWMGKRLKFASLSKHYIGRLYQPKNATYEEVTEEHLIHQCRSIRLSNTFYEDNIKNDIKFFVNKHIETASGELEELLKPANTETGNIFANEAHLVRRWFKLNAYNKLPMFLRGVFYFLYRYIMKGGFLDGKAGFSFCFFQAFFYRMLIDQMLWERLNGK